MHLSAVFAIFICDGSVVSTKEVHVVFVNNRAVICDCSWDMIGIACGLDKSPLVSTHKLSLFFIQKFVETRQVQFIEWVKWTFTNVKSSVHVKLPIKYEGAMITAPVWLLILEPHFVPILQLLGVLSTGGTHSFIIELLWLVGLRVSLAFFYHLLLRILFIVYLH